MRWKINRYRRPVVGEITFSPEVGYTFEASGDGLSFTVTKSGGGFGTKPHGQTPFFWLDVGQTGQASAMDPISRCTSWTGMDLGEGNKLISSSVVAPGSLYSAGVNTAVNAVGFTHSGHIWGAVDVGQVPDAWYLWLKRKWQFRAYEEVGNGDWNYKYQRVTTSSGMEPNAFLYTDRADASSDNHTCQFALIPQLAANGWAVNGANYYLQSSGLTGNYIKQRWAVNEWYVKQNSVLGAADGVLQVVFNALNGLTSTAASQIITRDASHPAKLSKVALDERTHGSLYTPEAWVYYDAMYMDDSWCRVLISDEPAWQEARLSDGGVEYTREIAPILSWSDTAISCRLRRGSHASVTGRYVYVIRNDGTALRIGQFH